MSETVEYRPIPGWPLYLLGSDGTIWSRSSRGAPERRIGVQGGPGPGWFLNATADPSPESSCRYRRVALEDHGRRKHFYLHSLVAETFLGPRPAGLVAMHLNDNKSDCRAANLKWGTLSENARAAIESGRTRIGERHYAARVTEEQVREIRRRKAAGESYSRIASEFSVTVGCIQGICERRTWKRVS